MRLSQRKNNELRSIEIIRNYTKHAEGSVLIKCGDTHVICTASIEQNVPSFLKGNFVIKYNVHCSDSGFSIDSPLHLQEVGYKVKGKFHSGQIHTQVLNHVLD